MAYFTGFVKPQVEFGVQKLSAEWREGELWQAGFFTYQEVLTNFLISTANQSYNYPHLLLWVNHEYRFSRSYG